MSQSVYAGKFVALFFSVDKSLNYGRKVIERFIASVSNCRTALDIGAGIGGDLLAVKKWHPQVELFGVEHHDYYVRYLGERGIKVFSINFECERIPMSDECVDLMISNQTLEHAKEIFWIFHEMSRCLKVGGHLIIGVPNLASLHNRLLLLFGRQPTAICNSSAHLRGFTKEDLLKVAGIFTDGFELVDHAGSNFYPFPPWLAKPLSRLFPNMSWAIFVKLKKIRSYNGEFLSHPVKQELETNFFLG
ncbi:MAG: hypothetical protein A2X86_12230 [Bdellovibrionales bacterium GWA2_49_15]|nr:MAG: hypothetical protein A2X86_12230 [Bdellovibrionales bacterium GWA2_49_15]